MAMVLVAVVESFLQWIIGIPFGGNQMKNFAKKLERFLKSEDGPTAVEYAVMLSLIVVVCLTAVTNIGKNAKSTFTSVSAQLGTAS